MKRKKIMKMTVRAYLLFARAGAARTGCGAATAPSYLPAFAAGDAVRCRADH